MECVIGDITLEDTGMVEETEDNCTFVADELSDIPGTVTLVSVLNSLVGVTVVSVYAKEDALDIITVNQSRTEVDSKGALVELSLIIVDTC